MVEGLPAVEGKQALGGGTLSRHVGCIEGLEGERKEGDGSSHLGQAQVELMAKQVEMRTLGSQVSMAYSHSELLNTLYTWSLDVDKKLGGTIG